MTAFSTKEVQCPWGALHWEMRSVNHRFCELNFKLPDGVKQIEITLRNILKESVQRGKIDCFLKLDLNEEDQNTLIVDMERIEHLITLSYDINEHLKKYQLNAPISPLEILNWPAVLKNKIIDKDSLSQIIEESFRDLLTDLKETRAREGHALKRFILDRTDSLKIAIQQIRTNWKKSVPLIREKLTEKILDLKVNLDQNRLEQEVLFYTQKSDISEELDRLETHTQEMERILKEGGVIGKRLDFLVQELNRETNTITAKATNIFSIQTAVNMKVLIEEMREQIQNIE